MNVNERVEALRALMAGRGIDVYYIPNEDDHLSEEYTAAVFRCKSYISGFSGEAGCVAVTKDRACLWTDGRYFTAAEEEIEGTCIELMRMGQEGVPAVDEFLVDAVPVNGVLGFDGTVVSAEMSEALQAELKKKNASVKVDEDLAGMVWGEERPSMPKEPLFLMDERYTGESASDRIAMVREEMKKKGADVLVLTRLEDPCWMLNVRGNDIPCTPVTYAFAVITEDDVRYYVDECKVTVEVAVMLAANAVAVRPYHALAEDLAQMHGKTIWAHKRSLNAYLYSRIPADNTIISELSPVMRFRSVKNETEIKALINAHIKDGAAMVKFLKYVKENAYKGGMTELSAQNYLYERRAEMEEYIEPSFPTICAYQANGAMMHYSATEEKYSDIGTRGFLLVDSGGTYKDGTTDITRTIAIADLTDLEKKYYTAVLRGHLALARPHFLKGTCGNNLDILARGPMWEMNIDYQCGTGHGVGHVLGVHEGVHGIRWGMPTAARPSVPLEPGMIVTNEPGIYEPHVLGIRIENELLVREDEKNFYGTWLKFEDVTYCPYDLDAIDVRYLNDVEIEQINAYHENVYNVLKPLLNEEEQAWLKNACRKIVR